MKLAGIPYTCGDLDYLLNQKKLIVGFAQVSQEKTLSYYSTKDAIRFDLNTLGWYQAHIHPVGKGYNGLSLKNYFPNPDRSEYNLTSKKNFGLQFKSIRVRRIKGSFYQINPSI